MLKKKILTIIFLLYFTVNILNPAITQKDTSEDYLFFVHMIAPTSNPIRMQFAQLIENELPKIGIDTELDLLNWAAMGPRCTDQEVGMHRDGGYDLAFFGLMINSLYPQPSTLSIASLFGANYFPYHGLNIGYWSPVIDQGYYNYRAQESENILTQLISEYNRTKIEEDLWFWQKIWYDALPNIVICNQMSVYPISSNLYGFDPALSIPMSSIRYLWFDNEETVLNFASLMKPQTFNSLLAADVFSFYAANPPMEGLIGFTPSKNIILPFNYDKNQWMIDNFGTTRFNNLYPRLASALGVYSSDHLQYNISVRDDAYWHDGARFDAWDVAFSFQANMNPAIGSSYYSNLIVPFGTDDKLDKHGNYSLTVEDKDSNGFYESVNFHFSTPVPFFESDYLGMDLFPEHILGDPITHGFDMNGDFTDGLWLIPPSEWCFHSTATGNTSDLGGYAGPIGLGPVIFKGISPTTGDITLEKFQNIAWNGIAWVENTSVSYYDQESITNMPEVINIHYISDEHDALDSLIKGNIHLLDPQYSLNKFIQEIRDEDSIKQIYIPESGWQGLFLNPKFNQDGIYHFQKKGVRHAISHMIPRLDIIEYLYNKLAQPAYTPLSSNSWMAIPEEEMIQYKNTLLATDGSLPEVDAISAYDDYNVDLAIEWMITEGYDIDYTATAPPIFNFIPGLTIFTTCMTLVCLSFFYLLIKKRKNM